MAYPANVRECIKQAYEYGRKKYKDSYIVVNVDAPGFGLTMKHRTKEESRWTHVKQQFLLPNECLNIARQVDQSVKLVIEQVRTPSRSSRLSGKSDTGTMDDETVFHSPNNHSVNREEGGDNCEAVANVAC